MISISILGHCCPWRAACVCVTLLGSTLSSHGSAALAEDVLPDLAPLLQQAVTQSPRMLASNLQRLVAEQQTLVSSSGLYPRVSFGGNLNLQYEDRTTGANAREWESNTRYNASLVAAYPLLNWGVDGMRANIGRLQADLAAGNVVQAYRQLALELRRAYLQVVLDQAAVRSARFNDELARRRYAVMETRVASGEVQSAVLGSLKIGLDESALTVDRAVRSAELNLRALRRLSGVDALDGSAFPAGIPAIPRVERNEAVAAISDHVKQRKFEDDYRYLNVEGQIKNQQRQLRIDAVSQRPMVDLVTGASVDQLSYVNNIGQRTGVTALYVGLRVSWNIFDGYSTRGRLLMGRTRLRQLEENLKDVGEDLQYAATVAGDDLEFTGRALSIAEGRYNGTRGSYDLTAENVKRNRASQDDLEGAQLSLNDAEMRLFSARVAYLNAVAAWLYSVNADPAVPASIPSLSTRKP